MTEGQIVVMAVMLLSSFESFFNLDIWSSSVSDKIKQSFFLSVPDFQYCNYSYC